MSKLSKTYQGADKPVLKIYLSFFYGAKILGLNGSGNHPY
jgi:hypothetical protein